MTTPPDPLSTPETPAQAAIRLARESLGTFTLLDPLNPDSPMHELDYEASTLLIRISTVQALQSIAASLVALTPEPKLKANPSL